MSYKVIQEFWFLLSEDHKLINFFLVNQFYIIGLFFINTKMKNYFITAIGTNSGKTLVSSILVDALQADYWKPIQSGTEDIDAITVERLINNNYSIIHPSTYLLKLPASPHAAADAEGIKIKLSDFHLPATTNNLVIEGAGGILVPLNYDGDVVIDLAKKFNCELILVSDLYLGSINHTMLTYNELVRRDIPIKGIVFNGDPNEASEKIILQETGLKCLLKIRRMDKVDSFEIKKYAIKLMEDFNE